jgi:DNA processing protein
MYKINSFSPDEHPFSQLTSDIANPPKKLWLMGNLPSKRLKTVAIVGTRKPTAYGQEVTYRLSYELAKRGIVIVSGLALGVDGIAHQAALEAGGTTIAVLPSSLTDIHPKTHHKLAQRIVESGGALISEYEGNLPTRLWNFIERNRIVAGLSDSVLITEAATRSGTLSTANFALEQGRVVMVVPGNITSRMSAGCNTLLKMGAAPITEVDDILHELGLTDPIQTALPLAATPHESILLQLIGEGVREGELLQSKSGLSASAFNQTMTMLEIEGKIRSLGANQWAVKN